MALTPGYANSVEFSVSFFSKMKKKMRKAIFIFYARSKVRAANLFIAPLAGWTLVRAGQLPTNVPNLSGET